MPGALARTNAGRKTSDRATTLFIRLASKVAVQIFPPSEGDSNAYKATEMSWTNFFEKRDARWQPHFVTVAIVKKPFPG